MPWTSVTAPAILTELIIGVTLGLAAGIFISAAESAGDMLAVQMGLSGANVLDPMSRTHMPVLGQFLGLFATSMILALGGHVVVLHTLGASLEALPMGRPLDIDFGLFEVVRLGSMLLWLGLRFAAPVIAAIRSAKAAAASNSAAAAIAARTSSSDITPLGCFLVVLRCAIATTF